MIKLVENWRDVLLKAWSARFMYLALLSGLLGFSTPLLEYVGYAFPEKYHSMFRMLAALFAILAIVSRVIAQPKTLPRE